VYDVTLAKRLAAAYHSIIISSSSSSRGKNYIINGST